MIKYSVILIFIYSISSQVIVDPYRLTAASGNNLLDDLLVSWSFEETSGDPQDSSGNGRHLDEKGTLETALGIIGNSRHHNSTENDDYFDITSAAWNTFGSNDFSISYWFTFEDPGGVVNDQVHICKADYVNGISWGLEIDSGFSYPFGLAIVFFYTTDGSDLTLQIPLTVPLTDFAAEGWYFVCLTRIGNDWKLYLGLQNGSTLSIDTETLAVTLIDNSTVPITVGSILSSGGVHTPQDTDGDIDEMSMWSRGLSECEVYKLFNAGVGRSFPTFDSNPCL